MSTRLSPERSLALALVLVLVAGAPAAGGQGLKESDDLLAQRQRIDAERRAVIEQAEQAERQCHTRFIVTPCVEDVRAQRRETLDRLQRELAVVDGALRQQKAAERLQRLSDKQRAQREAAGRPAPPPRFLERGVPAGSVAPVAPAASRSAATSSRPVDPATGTPQRDRNRTRTRSREAYEQRVKQAEQRREEVLQRNSRRAAEGRTLAPPLPAPAASDVGR